MTAAPQNDAAPAQTTTTTTKPYAALRQELVDAGCFVFAPWRALAALVGNVAAALALFGAASVLVQHGVYGVAGVVAGVIVFVCGSLCFYRVGWLMHDAAHGGVCASPRVNEAFAIACCAVLGEFLSGWRFGHNRHHAAPNVRGKDRDQSERWDPRYRYHSPVMATLDLFFFHRFGRWVRVPKSLALLGVRDGVYAYLSNRRMFPVELFWVLASLTAQGALFVALFGGWGLLALFVHLHIGLVYLNAVFSGNHYDREFFTPEQAAEIPVWALQVRTARNYSGGFLTRFFCGGLEMQIEHHLFPTMPRHHLHRAAPFVRAFCAHQGLAYETLPFFAALRHVVAFHLDGGAAAAPPEAQ